MVLSCTIIHVSRLVIIVLHFSGSSKVEEAVECYQRAANMFKMAKKWGAAGNAFCEAASLHAKAGSKHDAATNYVDAANCFKKSDPNGEASYCICISPNPICLMT